MSLTTFAMLLAFLAMVPIFWVIISYFDDLAAVPAGVCAQVSLENPVCFETFAACHAAGGTYTTWGDKLSLAPPGISMCRTIWDGCPGLAASAAGAPN